VIGLFAAFAMVCGTKAKQPLMTSHDVASQLKSSASNGLLKMKPNCLSELISAQLVGLFNVRILLDAPAHLKKELDTVLALQADIDNANQAIQATKIVMKKQELSNNTMGVMGSLERTHERLMSKVDMLYASLNVGDKFPELQDINLNFVRTLLLACDLKINICKQAIGSFFEWDKLDRAIGGTQKTLGMLS